jgi:exonuclease III
VLLTEHKGFVLLNVYAPNAGDRAQKARLDFKLRWFRALQEILDQLSASNRAVVVAGDLNIPRSREDVHVTMKWDGLYSDEV